MSNILNNLPKSIYKESFRFGFFLFILFFSTTMAGLIYWKEESSRGHIYFVEVLLWQIIIWLPWLFAIPIIEKGLKKINTKAGIFRYLIIIGFFMLFISVHWGWFVLYSSLFSPYIGAPAERYGVFQYFFIFWTLLDFVLLLAISAYFTLYKSKLKSIDKDLKTIQVRRGNKKVLLRSNNIYWISAEGYYALLYTDHGQFLLRRSLKDLIQTLPKPEFVRIHRSAIINIKHLNEVQQSSKNGTNVVMKDGNSHSVSRTYIKKLKEILKNTSV